MRTYLNRHLQVLFAAIGTFARTPFASLATILIIAITLVLPSILYITLKSGQQIAEGWQGRPQISIFIDTELGAQEAKLIFAELSLHPAIETAEFLTPQQALEEFTALSGMSYELDFLGENPLPASIVAMPDQENSESDSLQALKTELEKIEGIESIRLDLEWTDKFNSLLNTAERTTYLLFALLSAALFLIVGNTIKLLIMNRRDEIEVTKLVGGSNAFVRRPFLYYGFLFGVCGGVCALVLLYFSAIYISPALENLATLYQKETLVYQLNWHELLCIVAFGGALGWIAARLSVARHLRHIKPR
jgi:cell division transport system permease protein